MADHLLVNDSIVTTLGQALSRGEHGLDAIPGLLKKVIREDMWRERRLRRSGRLVTFDSFVEFIRTPPLEGLGAELQTVKNLCREDPEALDLLDRVMQRSNGVHATAVDNVNSRPDGEC